MAHFDEQGDYPHVVAVQRFVDFDPDPVVGVVEPPLPGPLRGVEPAGADHYEQDVGRGQRGLDLVEEVLAQGD